MGRNTNLNPACKTSGVKNHVYTSFPEHKKISLTAMPLRGQGVFFYYFCRIIYSRWAEAKNKNRFTRMY